MMKWYKFSSKEDFDLWHEGIKQQLGYPLPSKDSDGFVIGEPYIYEYTSVVQVGDNDWRSIIDEQYAEGLELSEAPVFPDEREIITSKE